MSVQLDARLEATGTKFRIFPQPRFLAGFAQPELIRISVPPNQMQAGPADDRMFVIDAINKQPYSRFTRPPYTGPANPPVRPNNLGHFDHLDPNSREFLCATMYATVRRTLDVWEDFFGHRIDWHFESNFARMEMIPLIEWDNAQSGFGFLEFGFGRKPAGGIDRDRPYCENFDVLAHELGHSIIFSQVGVPDDPADEAIDYGGMHESCGDLVAIVTVLHFNSVVDRLLANTRGNLFSVNELDRVGELSDSREIRTAFNYVRMSDIQGETEPHDRSLPLTGGIFDIMVEVFQKALVSDHLISADLAKRSSQEVGNEEVLAGLQSEFEEAFSGNERGFKKALLEARDYLGKLLAETWRSLNPPNFLTYQQIVRALLKADRVVTQGAHQETIRSCFAWREITVAPASLLARTYSLLDCGLAAAPTTVRLSGLSDDDLGRVIRLANQELENRASGQRVKRPAAGSRGGRKR